MKPFALSVLAALFCFCLGCPDALCAEDGDVPLNNAQITYVSRTPMPSPNVIAQGDHYIYYGDGSVIAVYNSDMTLLGRVQIQLDQNPGDGERAGTQGIAGIFYYSNGTKDTLYVACGNEGLQVFDVTGGNETAPVWKRTCIIHVSGLGGIRARAKAVYVSGDYAYVVYKSLTDDGYRTGIQTFKISDDPQKPVLKGECGTPEAFSLGLSGLVEREQGIVVHNGQAYITDYSNGVAVYDVDNPEKPTHEAWYLMQYAVDVDVSDGFVYVADGGYGLWMFPLVEDNDVPDDAIDSATIRACQYNEGQTLSTAVAVYGNYAYVADGRAGLVVIDISDPDAINTVDADIASADITALVQQYTPDMSGSYCIHVDDSGSDPVVYIGNRINGLQKISTNSREDDASAWDVGGVSALSSTLSPADADAFALDKAFETDKSYVYVVDDDPTDTYGNQEGVYVYYARLAADWIDFLYKGFLPTDGEARDVFVSGDYAYVADGSKGIKVIDPGLPGVDKDGYIKVKEAANPTLKGKCTLGTGSAAKIKVVGNYAYVAAEEGGLRIVNIADPAAPFEKGAVAGTDIPNAKSVDVSGGYAYVTGGLSGLQVVDVSSPDRPVLVGSCLLPGSANDVSLSGERAYVACRSAGKVLAKFDATDTAWHSYAPVSDLDVDAIAIDDTNGIAWLGTNGGGVRLFDMNTTAWLRVYNTDHGLANNDVEAIAIDSNDDVWMGTAGGGVSVFDPNNSSWTTYTSSDGLAGDNVETIAVDTSSSIVWIGTTGKGVSQYDTGSDAWITYNSTNSDLANDEVEGIALDGGGNVWFASDGQYSVEQLANGEYAGSYSDKGGVSMYNTSTRTWTIYDDTTSGIPYNEVEAIAADRHGHIWIGTEGHTAAAADGKVTVAGGGVSMYNGTGWTNYDTDDGLCSNRVITIAVDSSGAHDVLWFGTYGGGVSKCEVVDPDDAGTWVWTTYDADNGLAYNYVQCLTTDNGGDVWGGFFSENGGVFEVNVADPEQPAWVGDYVDADVVDVVGIYAAVSDENPDVDLIWAANGEDPMGFFKNPKTVPITNETKYDTSGFVKQVRAFGSFAVLAEGAGGMQVAGVTPPKQVDDDAWKKTVPTDLSRSSSSAGCFVWSVSSKTVLEAVADFTDRLF